MNGPDFDTIALGYMVTNNTTVLREISAAHLGEPDDVGGAALLLTSAASGYVHGIVLLVYGGRQSVEPQ